MFDGLVPRLRSARWLRLRAVHRRRRAETVAPHVSAVDSLGRLTGLFGETCIGKSHSMMKIIQDIVAVSESDATINTGPIRPVGQIIFDVNGEYANTNRQGTSNAIYVQLPQDVIRYGVLENTSWTKIGGPAGRLYGGAFGLFATNPSGGAILHYNHFIGPWLPVGGPGRTWVVTGDGLYGLTPNGDGVWKWNGIGLSWTKVGGPALNLYAGVHLYATNSNGSAILRYNDFTGVPPYWEYSGGPGSEWVHTGDLYGFTPTRQAVMRLWEGPYGRWEQIFGPADQIVLCPRLSSQQ